MKKILTFVLIFFTVISYSQVEGGTYFESGTLEGWTNTDGSTSNLSIEQPGWYGDSMYLQKICDGTNTVLGEMAIKNTVWFNYDYYNEGAAVLFNIINNNNFDLHMRIGFEGYEGTKIISTTPIIIQANSEWLSADFHLHNSQFTLLEGTMTIDEVLSDAYNLRIIHNEDISFDGASALGNLEIDDVGIGYLAGLDEFQNSIAVFPNPTTGNITIESKSVINQLNVYNSIGQLIASNNNQNSIDISGVSKGIYFLKISDENNKSSFKKIIKE